MDLFQTAETAVSQGRHAVCVILMNYLNPTVDIFIMEAVGSLEKSAQFSQRTQRQI
jgi:hypothetical protein